MSHYSADSLYQLLPALYRQRDAEQGQPLRALVEILAEQAQVVERDLLQLYDNWFVETCEPWVVPYLADLVGVAGLSGEELRRAEVANALAYRQRKGTPGVLEQLASDATGWPARAVPLFERVATTQHMNHARPGRRTIDLRRSAELEALGGPFEASTRTAGLRRGSANLPNLGLHLWRLTAFPLVRVVPFAFGDNDFFTFDPLGRNQQLFRADPPGPITRRSFAASVASFYGPGRSLEIWDGSGAPVGPERIVACDLTSLTRPVPAGKVAVDPVLGRIRFPEPQDPTNVRATWHYGFTADLGGGSYEREGSFPRIADERTFPVGEKEELTSISEALAAWGGVGSAVIEVRDSRTYGQEIRGHIPRDARLEIRAANEQRPALRAGLNVQGDERSRFEINGFLVFQTLRATGDLQGLTIRHSTFSPGSARLEIQSPTTEVAIHHSILGAITATPDTRVHAEDSILDASRRNQEAFQGGVLSLSRVTVIGNVIASELPRVEDTLFLGERVTVARRQEGIVRFSFLPPGSQTPRRYRCPSGPEVTPRVTSLTWGHPGYCQLVAGTPDEIRRGASDGSEMGAFASLHQPQREEYLRGRLADHLPAGIEAEILFAT